MAPTSAAYMREWRAKNREAYRINAARQAARVRALRRLAARYPDELDALYDEELVKDGLDRGLPGRPARRAS